MAAITANGPAAAASPMRIALKEAAITAFLVFMLSFLMIGFETQAQQGEQLSYVTRFAAIVWGIVLVPIGRILLVLNREGRPLPALVGGTLSFLYLFGGGAIAMAFDVLVIPFNSYFGEAAGAMGIPLPFADPMVDAIFGLGGLYLVVLAIQTMRQSAYGHLTVERREARDRRSSLRAKQVSMVLGPALLAVAVLLPVSPWGSRVAIETMTLILTYVMLGWGLNIVVGLAGLLDLGYVAFYAVGAYSYAKLATELGLDFWACLPLAGAFAAFFGVILGFPVLRLRGDYLAIVTLGFGEMIRITLINWQVFTGGPNGITGIPRISFFGLPFDRNAPEGRETFATFFGLEFSSMHRIMFLYYVILVLALITNVFTIRLRKLPIGRAWEALREDETACRALGINPTNTKLTAFAIGAMFAGFAGSFFAVRQQFVSPESFVFIESAVILAIVVLGGMGSQVGVALAAILLIGLPEVMRELSLYRMLAFGAVMVLIMLWRPRGLLAHREPTILLPRPGDRAKARQAEAAA